MADALSVLYREWRFNPNHGKDGKFASKGGTVGPLLTPQQYDLLRPEPDNVDSANLRIMTAQVLSETPQGKWFVRAVDHNEEEGSADLRAEVANIQNRKPVGAGAEEQTKRAYALALTDAIYHVPEGMVPDNLYRGMTMNQKVGDLQAKYPVGSKVNFALSSFSSRESSAGSFLPSVDDTAHTGVMLHWSPGKDGKAIPTENLAGQLRREHEWLTNGEFEVTGSSVKDGILNLEVKQNKVFAPKKAENKHDLAI